MNKIIVMFVLFKDTETKMFKWNSVEEFSEALRTNEGVPNNNAIVTEAYIDDNLVDLGNTFEDTVNKLKLVLDLQ